MKKILSFLLAGVIACTMAVAFAGCGSENKAKTIKSVDDLKGAIIGVQSGTTGDTVATDYEKDGATVNRYNKGADAVVALKNGKIDCVIIDSEPAKSFVANNSGLKILDTGDAEAFAKEEYAICMAKDKSDLLDKFNGALAKLKADGTVSKIINHYIGDEEYTYTTPAGTQYPNGTLHMATNAEFEPYEFIENNEIVGIDPMIATAICDKLGYKLEIDNMEFEAIIGSIQSGKADFGMAGMTVTEERKKTVNFSDTYAEAAQVIIVKK